MYRPPYNKVLPLNNRASLKLYNEARCTAAILALYECCAAFYQKNGDHATSLSCPQPEILRQRLESMKS
ncbi:hypothetical protein TD95_001911 [Thielaviopsis punctulata]|uniref:Cx9C motif-containing protein 4, mitochondrial n=1 Tax=Thielaviopsis punctulata TaxID=72032 RepID=A0A0F4ZHY0_9PEZI|nr:hypothetical protein TD95_001911 [Thielaviopsis punctulata]